MKDKVLEDLILELKERQSAVSSSILKGRLSFEEYKRQSGVYCAIDDTLNSIAVKLGSESVREEKDFDDLTW